MKILVTGPESTGKSSLAAELSDHFNLPLISEYARAYLSDLKRGYTADDVLEIARHHIRQYEELSGDKGFVMDTYLVNIKIWLREKYEIEIPWFEEYIRNHHFDHIFLCSPDIPWITDPLRESPHDRQRLFTLFQKEFQSYGQEYFVINGKGNERFQNAVKIILNSEF